MDEHYRLDVLPVPEPLVVARQFGQGLFVCVVQFCLFLQVEPAAFHHGLCDIVNLLNAVQARNGDYSVTVQNVSDSQTRTLEVLFSVIPEQRAGGKRLNTKGADVLLLEGFEDTVFLGSLAHRSKGEADTINLREILNHKLNPSAVVG